MSQINLLQETLDIISANGLTTSEVEWVGSKDGSLVISWKDFEVIADFEYDRGYGGTEIALDLVVVGNGWWLERHEYDGAEWWEFKTLPTVAINYRPFSSVFDTNNDSLADINKQVENGR